MRLARMRLAGMMRKDGNEADMRWVEMGWGRGVRWDGMR
jgi:hypothetical protein